jgi:hypothetical protein
MDRAIKKHVEDLLRKRDFNLLLEQCERDRRFWQEVRFRLYDMDERLRWPAIEMAAKRMQCIWNSGKEEKVRTYIRTLFWSMTDESGGIGWNAPQTIAEIIVHIPELIDPYGSMMIAYSIDERPLVKGGLWGIGRLGPQIKESVDFFKDKVLAAFEVDDDETLVLAAWAMGEAGVTAALPFLRKVRLGIEPVRIYIDGDFREKTLTRWVAEAITKIEDAGQK